METSLAADELSNALSLANLAHFFIEIWAKSDTHLTSPDHKNADMTGSYVNSPLPNKYLLTPEKLMEMSLVSDGLSSALWLPYVRQFFIEIWATSISHCPPTDADMTGG